MKTNKIEVLLIAADETVSYDREFDTIKEAKQWIKECALNDGALERMMESDTPGWAKRNVDTVQLLKNGEIVADWFPKF